MRSRTTSQRSLAQRDQHAAWGDELVVAGRLFGVGSAAERLTHGVMAEGVEPGAGDALSGGVVDGTWLLFRLADGRLMDEGGPIVADVAEAVRTAAESYRSCGGPFGYLSETARITRTT